MVSHAEKLGPFLKEVTNWDWYEFVQAEHDKAYSTSDSIIFSLVRAVTLQKMDAIRIALNRLDGKLKTPVKIEFPKVFYIYPNAKLPDIERESLPAPIVEQNIDSGGPVEGEVIPPEDVGEWQNEEEYTALPTLSLRETLAKMSDYPRDIPEQILSAAQQVEEHVRGQPTTLPPEIPRVKSVIAAHLLTMAQNRNIDAFYEVFDQIDGKLVETIQFLGPEGGDVHIPIYSGEAPAGAYLNENGVLQIEATQAQDVWTQKLKQGIKGNG